MDIKVDPEFAALVPPLTAEELAGLEASIKTEGCRDALIAWNELLLDGHNRKRICDANGIAYGVKPISLSDRLAAEIWILTNQASRRNLIDDQRAVLVLKLGDRLSEQAKRERAKKGTPAREAKKAGRTLATASAYKVEHSRSKAAKSARVSERKVRQAAHVRKAAPDLLAKVAAGTLKLRAAEKEIGKRERAAARAAIPADLPATTDRYRVYKHDIREYQFLADDIPAGSVDWIITDPPYPKEYLPLYRNLACFGANVLRPGGGMLVMVGHSYLPEVLLALHATEPGQDGLTYHWTLAYLTPGGQAVQVWDRKVNTFWKPLLWFTKGKYAGDWIGDVCRSAVNDNDKKHHDWGQSESGMGDIIERFTLPGQTICDPFCGGGTTGVVAVKMNRLFIGIDIDLDAVNTTKDRLHRV